MYEEQTNLSITDAAAGVLGVARRTLVDYLSLEQFAGRTLQETRQTKTGLRPATMLPPDLLADLADFVAERRSANTLQRGAENVAGDAPVEGAARNVGVSAAMGPPAHRARPGDGADYLAALLSSQADVIVALERRAAASEDEIVHLRGVVGELQRSLSTAMELAHREQALNMGSVQALLAGRDDGEREKKTQGVVSGGARGYVKARMKAAFSGR
jgi:hypothetical protein